MLKAVYNNPYRQFGVYSNSSKKEQLANKARMQAFLRVKKSISLPLDLLNVLPVGIRTLDTIERADAELSLPVERIKHAQFWFVKKTPIDTIAFNHLFKGEIDAAMMMWYKVRNISSLQNLFVCYLIKEDYERAIAECAVPLYDEYAADFVHLIDENAQYSVSDLINTIVETLIDEGIDLTAIAKRLDSSKWKVAIENKAVAPLLTKLEGLISTTHATKGKGPLARLNAGQQLMSDSKPLLDSLRAILSAEDTRYGIIADKVSKEVLQCSIDYYNDTSEADAPAKAMPLCKYALSIAVGNAAKQRCQDNYEKLKHYYDLMPPLKVVSEAKKIDDLISTYLKQSNTSDNALELLKKARVPLISIKEKLGCRHKYYLEISSKLSNLALNNVIDEVNDAQDGSRYQSDLFGISSQGIASLRNALKSAWSVILYLDLLERTSEAENRYHTNRQTLHSILSRAGGFSYSDSRYSLKGCAYGIKVDKRFFFTDDEFFETCKNRADYEAYLKSFPLGKHAEEANRKIEESKSHDNKMMITIGFVILLPFILIALIVSLSSGRAFVGDGSGSGYVSTDSDSVCVDSTMDSTSTDSVYADSIAAPSNDESYYYQYEDEDSEDTVSAYVDDNSYEGDSYNTDDNSYNYNYDQSNVFE